MFFLVGSVFVFNLGQAKTIWIRYAPTFWITSLAEEGKQNALDELIGRYDNDSLSTEQISNAVDAGLRIQAASSAQPLLLKWLNFLGKMMTDGKMTVAQESQFLKNALDFTFIPRQVIRQGDKFAVALEDYSRCPENLRITTFLLDCSIRIGETVIFDGKGSYWNWGSSGIGCTGSKLWQDLGPIDLPPGEHEIILSVHRKTFINPPGDARTAPGDVDRDDVYRAPLTILDSDADDPIQTTSDPATGEAIRACTEITNAIVAPSQSGTGRQFVCNINFIGSSVSPPGSPRPVVPPTDIAFRAIVRANLFEQEIGTVKGVKGRRLATMLRETLDTENEFIDDLLNAKSVTIILRGDIDLARQTPDLTNIWTGELRFDDLPLTVQ